VVGDAQYGGPAAPARTRSGQLRHAYRISLSDGSSFAVGAPADFVRALSLLRKER
jgi:hypothetical protein